MSPAKAPSTSSTSTPPQIEGEDVVVSSDSDDAAIDESVADSSAPSTSQKKKKKKKSKVKQALKALRGGDKEIPQEVVDSVAERVRAEGTIDSEDITSENVRLALEHLKLMDLVKGKAGPAGLTKKDMGEHKFWSTQPVPQPGEGPPLDDGYIEPSKPREEVQQDPYPLPRDFEWSLLDIGDPKQNKEVYDLLSLNYVEDEDAAFRFQYSAEFLRWALTPPGYFKEWHIGVRVSATKKLVAFISGVPVTLRVRGHVFLACEINYLCVLKKLRSKRLAPVLIKEVTRQVHLKGIFQAIYTGGVVIPTPVSTCRYYHRSLNVKKLIDIQFSYVPRNMTLARMILVNKVPAAPSLAIREMEEKDLPAVSALYAKYSERFQMVAIMTPGEVAHHFLSGKGTGEIGDGGPNRRIGQVTWAYVVEDPKTQRITDFFSFYSLPSTIIKHPTHGVLEAAYLYYYATETAFEPRAEEGKLKKRLHNLIGDALVVAYQAKFDVFNALTLMDNVPVLQDLKFGAGDGHLNFYLYNWRTAPLAGLIAQDDTPAGKGVGIVML